jgi:uncharacterized protein with HEPN domain
VTARPGQFTALQFLGFMQDSLARILEDTGELTREEFFAKTRSARQVRDAVIYNIGALGETAHDLETHHPDFVTSNPQIPIADIYGMRNRLFHEYHSIDLDVVWTTCRSAVPDLDRQVRAAIAGFVTP